MKVYNILYHILPDGEQLDPNPTPICSHLGVSREEAQRVLDTMKIVHKRNGWDVEEVDENAHGEFFPGLGCLDSSYPLDQGPQQVCYFQPVAWDPDSETVIPEANTGELIPPF